MEGYLACSFLLYHGCFTFLLKNVDKLLAGLL
jgi:hypothetical protein